MLAFCKRRLLVGCLLGLLGLLLLSPPALAQGSVTPAFGNGLLTLTGEGYRPGERVEITVRAGGQTHQLSATADGRGRFRLETGISVPPLSAVEIEARDEQGLTQVTMTSAPAAGSGSGGGMPLPPAPATGDSAPATGAPAPATSAPGPATSDPAPPRMPTQLPRTGGSVPVLPVLAGVLLLAGLLLRQRSAR